MLSDATRAEPVVSCIPNRPGTPTDAHHFDWMIGTNLHGEQEDTIVNRLALADFRTAVNNGIDRGEVSPTQWTHYINGVLIPALDLPEPPAKAGTRINIPRTDRAQVNLPRAAH